MNEFRRWILSVAGAVQIWLMICATLGFGMVGASIGTVLAIGQQSQGGGFQLFGFLLGAATGFLLSASAASFIFALIEIEQNTRASSERLIRLTTAAPEPKPNNQESTLRPLSLLSNAATTESIQGDPRPHAQRAPIKTQRPPFDRSKLKDEWSVPFSEGARLIEITREIILKARQAGYQVHSEGNVVIFKKAASFLTPISCYNNVDIIEFWHWNGDGDSTWQQDLSLKTTE